MANCGFRGTGWSWWLSPELLRCDEESCDGNKCTPPPSPAGGTPNTGLLRFGRSTFGDVVGFVRYRSHALNKRLRSRVLGSSLVSTSMLGSAGLLCTQVA